MRISAFPPENAPKPARVCAETGRPFEPNEKIYTFLFEENGEIRRRDLCADAFASTPRPQNALAWWSSRFSTGEKAEKKEKIAPNDALTDLFESLAERPDEAALRYVLALLLTRRRVLRFEREEFADDAFERSDAAPSLVVYSPRRETSYVVPVVEMNADEIAAVETRLLDLIREPSATLDAAPVKTVFSPPLPADDVSV